MKERERPGQFQKADVQIALYPFFAMAFVYSIASIFEPSSDSTQAVLLASFIGALTSLVVNAFKDAAYRREEKARWEQQQDLLMAIRDRL